MAKSLRSKWKRKMRAVKRVRYGEKEKAKLVKMLDDFKKHEEERKKEGSTENDEHAPQVLGSEPIAEGSKDTPEGMDTTTEKHVFSSKSLKNQHGNYPVWMSKRKVKKAVTKKKKRLAKQKQKKT